MARRSALKTVEPESYPDEDRPVISIRLSYELEEALNLVLNEKRHKKAPPPMQHVVEEALTNYFRSIGYL